MTVGLLTVRDARLVKHGASLVATARVTDADLRGVLPVLRTVTPVTSAGGQLILRGTADVLGVPISVDFSVRVSPAGRSSSHPTFRSAAPRRSPPSATRRYGDERQRRAGQRRLHGARDGHADVRRGAGRTA